MKRAFLLILGALTLAGCLATSDTSVGPTATTAPAEPSTTSESHSTTTVAGTSSTSSTGVQPDIIITGGTTDDPELSLEGPDLLSFALGDTVLIRVASSVTGELHVHGYDLHFDLVEGQVTVVEFPAEVPGIFEAELEETGQLIFELEVTP